MAKTCRALLEAMMNMPDRPVQMAIIPLANPKGMMRLCEICKQPAYLACGRCRVTFYCDMSHMEADWDSIHQMLCADIAILRQPMPFLTWGDDRIQQAIDFTRFKERMMAVAMTRCRNLLFEEKYKLSMPAAMLAISLCRQIYGSGNLGVAEPTLLLAEAHIGVNNHVAAEKYVKQVEWIVLQNQTAPNSTKAALYRAQGMLLTKQGCYDMARRSFANAIYYAALETGSTHVSTAGGYYHLANVFLKEGKTEVAVSMYFNVAEIWLKHLNKLVEIETAPPPKRRGVGPGIVITPPETMEPLVETQETEALHTLLSILQIRLGLSKRT